MAFMSSGKYSNRLLDASHAEPFLASSVTENHVSQSYSPFLTTRWYACRGSSPTGPGQSSFCRPAGSDSAFMEIDHCPVFCPRRTARGGARFATFNMARVLGPLSSAASRVTDDWTHKLALAMKRHSTLAKRHLVSSRFVHHRVVSSIGH
jgi:hypothetical protein